MFIIVEQRLYSELHATFLAVCQEVAGSSPAGRAIRLRGGPAQFTFFPPLRRDGA
jgi:hypothetical protein